MRTKEVYNGWIYDGKSKGPANAHLSYKGKSIIVDYELCLHPYDNFPQDEYVPIEMYPHKDDIVIGQVKLDKHFKKADLGELIEKVEEWIKEENE